ncbi:hypothetical protein GGR56DRAFT_683713 [Xylariaceae sp. FL0804]|nr:hypothetical protein GGR56DRAFT_683713 [Xylariaceae sp. FL0804]
MATSFPSIQTFYSREVAPGSSTGHDALRPGAAEGDGFTSSEVEAALNPLAQPWAPSRPYETRPIMLLELGCRNYQITGRLVNFTSPSSLAGDQGRSEGHYFLVVADGSAAIAVKLLTPRASDCQPLLGQRVTLWTSYIADPAKARIGQIPLCLFATTLYPGRNGATHIVFHADAPASPDHSALRCPLLIASTRDHDSLPGLMTLKSFLSSGYDLGEGKILVCVRSVGPRRTVRPKKREGTLDLVEVGIFDDTAACVLKLWQDKVASAKTWTPNHTVLLISQPSCRIADRLSPQGAVSFEIGIAYSTMVDVDPDIPEAEWLRTKVQNMAKRESVLVSFPSQTWDIEQAIHRLNRVLYTLAEVDEQVRQDPTCNFTGKLNVIIIEMNLMESWRKNTTCCVECCGIPLYSNKPTGACKNCGTRRELSLNPRILGSIIDESGTIAGSKLVWHDSAWAQLLFGNDPSAVAPEVVDLVEQCWEDITLLDNQSVRLLEEQLLYSRVTLTFGWSAELARMCVLGAEW